jgi:hypothetical protein
MYDNDNGPSRRHPSGYPNYFDRAKTRVQSRVWADGQCPLWVCSSGGIDELSRDAHAVCRFANAPFQHVTHPKLAPDLLHIDGATLVGEARVAGDDEQRLEMR